MSGRTQKFLLDDKKLGRLLKVETFEVTRTLNQRAITGKKKTVTKKKYLITVYNRTKVKEEVFGEDGKSEIIEKDKFVKWGEFTFAEAMHPKDRIKEMLSKIEIPLSYITDNELMDEATRREILQLEKLPDEVMIKEMKRRGLTEFANNFKISKNATFFQKIKAFFWERREIPDAKLTFEETVEEIKKRHLLLPEDFMSDDELIKDLERRDIRIELQTNNIAVKNGDKDVLDALFEDETPASPDVLDISDITGIPAIDLKGKET